MEELHLEKDGAKAIVLKGLDSQGRKKQMAMTVFAGWQELFLEEGRETNPDADRSLVIGASLNWEKLYGYQPFVLVSQVITRESWEDFDEDEIFSVKEISFCDGVRDGAAAGEAAFGAYAGGCGGYGPVRILMKDGREITVDYEGMDGRLQI